MKTNCIICKCEVENWDITYNKKIVEYYTCSYGGKDG